MLSGLPGSHVCYGLPDCSPPCTDLTSFPANGGLYFQAFDGSVTLPLAGYDYSIDWTPMLTGLSPAGLTASLAAPIPGIIGIVGRLHVEPATRMGDGEIRVHVRDSLIEEPAFQRLEIRECVGGQFQLVATFPKGHAALSTSKFRKGLSF